jgi:hypothetical protein
MKPVSLALCGALVFAADAAGAVEPMGYLAPDGVNAVAVTQANPMPVGLAIMAGATFTTPSGTGAYASGQLIANSATAGSVTPLSFTACRANGGTGMVRRARIKTTDTGFAAAALRLHLYKSSPTVANGDHATFSSTESEWLENIDVVLDQAFSEPTEKGVGVPNHGVEVNFDCAAGSQVIYGLVEARGAITPQGAKPLSVILEALAN